MHPAASADDTNRNDPTPEARSHPRCPELSAGLIPPWLGAAAEEDKVVGGHTNNADGVSASARRRRRRFASGRPLGNRHCAFLATG